MIRVIEIVEIVEIVRSLQEISKNLSGNLKIEIPSCEQMLSHSIEISL
jgi:hypothetical protein